MRACRRQWTYRPELTAPFHARTADVVTAGSTELVAKIDVYNAAVVSSRNLLRGDFPANYQPANFSLTFNSVVGAGYEWRVDMMGPSYIRHIATYIEQTSNVPALPCVSMTNTPTPSTSPSTSASRSRSASVTTTVSVSPSMSASATASGSASRTPSGTVTPRVPYERSYAAAGLNHSFGAVSGSEGWAVTTLEKGAWAVFGPYASDVPLATKLCVYFHLSISDATTDKAGVVVLDVFNKGTVLNTRYVQRQHFNAANERQSFPVCFKSPSTGSNLLEYRVWTPGAQHHLASSAFAVGGPLSRCCSICCCSICCVSGQLLLHQHHATQVPAATETLRRFVSSPSPACHCFACAFPHVARTTPSSSLAGSANIIVHKMDVSDCGWNGLVTIFNPYNDFSHFCGGAWEQYRG